MAAFMHGGLTFYGGYAGILCYITLLLAFGYKKILPRILGKAVPALCIGHSLGRIGCFFAGCCGGITVEPVNSLSFRIPTQLFEAGFLLILSIVLSRKVDTEKRFLVYLYVYSIFRFFIEFLRNDDSGKLIYIFRPSQIAALFIIVLVLLIKIRITHVGNITEMKEY